LVARVPFVLRVLRVPFGLRVLAILFVLDRKFVGLILCSVVRLSVQDRDVSTVPELLALSLEAARREKRDEPPGVVGLAEGAAVVVALAGWVAGVSGHVVPLHRARRAPQARRQPELHREVGVRRCRRTQRWPRKLLRREVPSGRVDGVERLAVWHSADISAVALRPRRRVDAFQNVFFQARLTGSLARSVDVDSFLTDPELEEAPVIRRHTHPQLDFCSLEVRRLHRPSLHKRLLSRRCDVSVAPCQGLEGVAAKPMRALRLSYIREDWVFECCNAALNYRPASAIATVGAISAGKP